MDWGATTASRASTLANSLANECLTTAEDRGLQMPESSPGLAITGSRQISLEHAQWPSEGQQRAVSRESNRVAAEPYFDLKHRWKTRDGGLSISTIRSVRTEGTHRSALTG
jgi:hypothetical protein